MSTWAGVGAALLTEVRRWPFMPGAPCPVGGKGRAASGQCLPTLLLDVKCVDFCERAGQRLP